MIVEFLVARLDKEALKFYYDSRLSKLNILVIKILKKLN